ncbi:MAG: hypothetical protein BWX67_01290 [Thermotogae bacterium ADurb.Bin062]|nr:MAG: hypothetical protein BWX67_01290 [Thermotogota bacterium ADurb.Bin062]
MFVNLAFVFEQQIDIPLFLLHLHPKEQIEEVFRKVFLDVTVCFYRYRLGID